MSTADPDAELVRTSTLAARRRLRRGKVMTVCALGAGAVVGLAYPIIGTLPSALATIGVALALGVGGAAQRRKLYHALPPVVDALNEGALDRAERLVDDLERRFRWPAAVVRGVASFRAVVLTRQARLVEARAQWIALDQTGGLRAMHAEGAETIAYLEALLGNLESARTWMAEARRRGTQRPDRMPYVVTDAVIDLRAGDARAVATRLDDAWPKAQHALEGARLRPLAVLRAFAHAQAGGVREAATASRILATLQPVALDEFAPLVVAWPELEQFLRTHLGDAP